MLRRRENHLIHRGWWEGIFWRRGRGGSGTLGKICQSRASGLLSCKADTICGSCNRDLGGVPYNFHLGISKLRGSSQYRRSHGWMTGLRTGRDCDCLDSSHVGCLKGPPGRCQWLIRKWAWKARTARYASNSIDVTPTPISVLFE